MGIWSKNFLRGCGGRAGISREEIPRIVLPVALINSSLNLSVPVGRHPGSPGALGGIFGFSGGDPGRASPFLWISGSRILRDGRDLCRLIGSSLIGPFPFAPSRRFPTFLPSSLSPHFQPRRKLPAAGKEPNSARIPLFFLHFFFLFLPLPRLSFSFLLFLLFPSRFSR